MVTPGSPFGSPEFVGQSFCRYCRRVGIWHFENGGDASANGGTRAGLDVFFMGGARFAKVDLGVDHARHGVQPGGIYFVLTGFSYTANCFDSATRYGNIALRYAAHGNNRSVANYQVVRHVL